MATVLFSFPDRFPPFTTVSVYRRSDQNGGDPLPEQVPNGSAVTSAQVDDEARLTFTDLSANTRYVAYALVEGKHHLLPFATEPDPPAWSGPGAAVDAVLVVAAADSREKTGADYIATGTGDQAKIQAALDAFAAAGKKGVVQLLDGTFTFSGAVVFGPQHSGLKIAGAGQDRTIVAGDPGAAVAFFDLSQTVGQTLADIVFADFTLDARNVTQPATNTVSMGLIRDTGAGTIDGFAARRVRFRGGQHRNTTPINFYSDTGTNYRTRIQDCRVDHDGFSVYGFQIRKRTVGVWIEGNRVELTGAQGTDPYNAIAIYANSSDFHVNSNTVISPAAGAHAQIAISPASGGEIIGNIVHGVLAPGSGVDPTLPAGGEGGIEVEYKTTHGGDADTSHDIVVMGNVVYGGKWGAYVTNRDDAIDTTKRPYNVAIAFNVFVDQQARGVMLAYGSNVAAFGNRYMQTGTPAANYKDFEQLSTCTGSVNPGSGIAGLLKIVGGIAPTAPIAAAAQIADGGVYLPNDRAIQGGNAAGTSFQPLVKRSTVNGVQIGDGGGGSAINADTSGRVAITGDVTSPSTYDGQSGTVVIFNAKASLAAGTHTTRVTIKQGDAQVVGGSGQANELLRFQANGSTTTLASVRSDGLINALAGVAHKVKAGTPSDADFAFAPPDGTVVVDTTASKIWARIGGTWKSTAALT